MRKKKSNNREEILDQIGRVLLNRPTNDANIVFEEMVFMSKDAEKKFNEASEPVKKSILDLLRQSADEMTKDLTIQSLVECVKELQDRVDELEAKNEETCSGCKNNRDRVHAMIHALLPILNSEHPLVGQVAMTQLIVSQAQDRGINKDAFLLKMSAEWDEVEARKLKNDDEDDEDDEE